MVSLRESMALLATFSFPSRRQVHDKRCAGLLDGQLATSPFQSISRCDERYGEREATGLTMSTAPSKRCPVVMGDWHTGRVEPML